MKVPFLDLYAQYKLIQAEVDEEIQKVIKSCAFAGGPFVSDFEDDFSRFCQCEYTVGVGSGTDALWLALLALGVGYGDEVITVPNTFIATAEAISYCGATPVFVDVDSKTHTMNPELIEKSITPKTKAIIPVHLFGQTADMDPIMEIARKHNLYVIEDACQAHGAKYNGKPAGSIGDAGCFSFYPGKNLGAFGEAGAVTTNNKELYEAAKVIRDHGQDKKYYHKVVGWNARMDGIQGAVLRVKLKNLAERNDARRRHAALYNTLLSGVDGIVTPTEADYAMHVYHIYAIQCQNRDSLLESLAAKDIACGIHYPVPVHLQDAYQFLGYKAGSQPVAEKAAAEFLSLPMFPELTEEQIHYVADEVKAQM